MAVKKISEFVDMFLVIGAENSSNCNRLREVAEKKGLRSYLINSLSDLDIAWLKNVNNVGITSGASTPENLVNEIVDFLNPEEVVYMGGEEENITFNLPVELR